MIYTRTCTVKNRAELIRFSQRLFSVLPQALMHCAGQSFDIAISGDTQSAKSLVPLAGLHGLSDEHEIEDLLAQRVRHGEVEAENPYSINRFLKENAVRIFHTGGAGLPVGFTHTPCGRPRDGVVFGEEKLAALKAQMPGGGVNILTFSALPWGVARQARFFPSVPLRLDIRKTVADMYRDADRTAVDWPVALRMAFDRYARPSRDLCGAWTAAAKADPGHDISLPRRIVVMIDDANPVGAALLQDTGFAAFWNGVRRPARRPAL